MQKRGNLRGGRQKDEQQRVKPNRGVGSRRSWRVVFRRAFSPEAIGAGVAGGAPLIRCLFGGNAVVEHKAQTHLRGFAVVSLLVGASCPDAHMYRSGADVRHMPGAGWGEEKQHNPALSGTMHPQGRTR